jgi:hypothetical protein
LCRPVAYAAAHSREVGDGLIEAVGIGNDLIGGRIYPGWYRGRAVHIHFKVRTPVRTGGSTSSPRNSISRTN